MKKIIVLILVLGVIAGAGFFLYQGVSEGIVVRISEEEIQSQLDEKFPIEKGMLVLKTTVSDPKVHLKEGADRVHFSANVNASIPTQKPVTGAAEISGKVAYAPESAEFYLEDAAVESLEISGVPEKYSEQVRAVVGQIAKEALNRYPIYKLDESDRKQALAKLFLKSVSVSQGNLEVVMALQSP